MKGLYALAIAAVTSLASCIYEPCNCRDNQLSQLLVNCFVSRSGATVFCKRYDSTDNFGALVELHPDFNEGLVCFYTKGNQDLCDLNQIADLERRIFGSNKQREMFAMEVAGIGGFNF